VRSTDRGIARLLHDHFYRHLEPQRPESLHNPRCAQLPPGTKRFESQLEDFEPGDMERQNVNLAITFVRTQLYTWYDAQPQSFPRRGCQGNAGESVVIGEGQRSESYMVCGSRHRIGRKRPVGRRRM
jgi:hypothetical protein